MKNNPPNIVFEKSKTHITNNNGKGVNGNSKGNGKGISVKYLNKKTIQTNGQPKNPRPERSEINIEQDNDDLSVFKPYKERDKEDRNEFKKNKKPSKSDEPIFISSLSVDDLTINKSVKLYPEIDYKPEFTYQVDLIEFSKLEHINNDKFKLQLKFVIDFSKQNLYSLKNNNNIIYLTVPQSNSDISFFMTNALIIEPKIKPICSSVGEIVEDKLPIYLDEDITNISEFPNIKVKISLTGEF